MQTFAIADQKLRTFALLVSGVILITLGAKISIPLKPIPITLHTAAVILLGLLYTPKMAAGSVLSYLFIGLCGVPVFTGALAGPLKFISPGAGYYYGFVVAAYVISYINNNSTNYSRIFCSSIIGSAIIFACGVSWLALFLGDFNKAIMTGFVPFIIPGVGKAFLVSYAVYYIKLRK
jgi:biotin transport system substrate-specific component